MLKVNIICIGKIKEKYFTDAVNEYAKRLGAFCKFAVVELPEERIKSNTPNAAQIDEVLTAEGKRILQKIAPSDYVAAMCIEGKLLSSEELSDTLSRVAVSGKSTVDFVIGGSYGLSKAVKQRAYQYGITEKDSGDPNADSVNGFVLTPSEKQQRQALMDLSNTVTVSQDITELQLTNQQLTFQLESTQRQARSVTMPTQKV